MTKPATARMARASQLISVFGGPQNGRGSQEENDAD